MAEYDPNNPNVPLPWATNVYIPKLWRRRDEEHWRVAATAMSRNWTPTPPPPYHEELLNASQRLVAEGTAEKYQLAVVMAQAACEILTEQVIMALIETVEPKSLRDWMDKLSKRRRNDLAEEWTRDLYAALTGVRINTGEGLWQEYATHVLRRHKVVHAGKAVSKEDATHSYETARKAIGYLQEVQVALTRLSDPP